MASGVGHGAYGAGTIPPIAPARQMPPTAEQLYLATTINGNHISQLLPFMRQDGDLWASPVVLRSIGFKNVDDTQALIRLESLHGTRAIYEMAHQVAIIQAPLSELELALTVVGAPKVTEVTLTGGNGALLNYDLYSTRDLAGSSSLSATTELRAFDSRGLISNTMLTQIARSTHKGDDGRPADWRTRNVRLDTSWSSSWVDDALTLTVGDTATGGLAWTRPTRIGGIRFGRNFALQPYLGTAPLPAFMGNAVVPSAVDLYIDGVKRYNGNVPAGPFELNTLPTISGHGTAQVVLTDATGRRTEVSIPFYAGSGLLGAGLTDWSVEAGFVREQYGLSSFSYARAPMFAATLRHGLTRALTLETHVETAQDTAVAGVGAVTTVGPWGQLNASYASSRSAGTRGSQYSLGYQWQSRYFNVGANTTRAQHSYRDVGSMYGSNPARVSESVVVGTQIPGAGSINANYIRVVYAGNQVNRYAGLYWSRSIGTRATLSANLNRNLDDKDDMRFFVGLSVSFDGRVSAYSSMQRQRDDTSYSAGVSGSAPTDTDWRWALNGQRNRAGTVGTAEVEYQGRYGDYRAGISTSAGGRSSYAGTSGALVLMGGDVFAGKYIYDGFAVVSTAGVSDVPVKLHNNPVGRTNDQGMLLVSPLHAYQKNLLTIDPMALPLNVRIDRVAAEIATRDRAGTLVDFVIEPVRAASVILHDNADKYLSLGAAVMLNQSTGPFFVGYDGEVYLEGLDRHNRLEVTTNEGSCALTFDFEDSADTIARIGPLRCE